MDAKQLIDFLKQNGLFDDKVKTKKGLFATAIYSNFTAQQVGNRASAAWKTAQYIIVDDCEPQNIHILLEKWNTLTNRFKDQYLLVYNTAINKYNIYNYDGELLGDDSILQKIISNTNTPLWIWENKLGDSHAVNKIFYGVPGCGKSYHIEYNILGKNKDTKKYDGDFQEKNIIRTTFYQDYSNTDFVGQILPKIIKGKDGKEDTVEYIFNPGPFTLALVQAIKNPTEKVALVVEEINRGNAPAIFGDIFQLLDRNGNSISEYGITNVGVEDYLKTVNFGTDEEPLHYEFDDIKIPGNLYIYATMNTSDQNVYTLDTAFTRRWDKERIENNIEDCKFKGLLVPGMKNITWGKFVDKINNQIQNKLDDLQVNEDKQVGTFFIKESDLLPKNNTLSEEDMMKKAKAFAHKVLEYLWDDVSKLDHNVIFNPSYKTFGKVVEEYIKNGTSVFNSAIFKDDTAKQTSKDSE